MNVTALIPATNRNRTRTRPTTGIASTGQASALRAGAVAGARAHRAGRQAAGTVRQLKQTADAASAGEFGAQLHWQCGHEILTDMAFSPDRLVEDDNRGGGRSLAEMSHRFSGTCKAAKLRQ